MASLRSRLGTAAAAFLLGSAALGCGSADTSANGSTDGGSDESAPVVEGAVPEEASDPSIDLEEVFADIVSFDGDPKYDAMFAALQPLHGPTADLSATVGTVTPFPEVATPAGAVIDGVTLRDDAMSVRLSVPLSVEEATEFFVTDLESRGWPLASNRTDPDGDTDHRFEKVWEGESSWSQQLGLAVRSEEQPGNEPDRTIVVVESLGFDGPPELRSAIIERQTGRLTGWELAVPEGAVRTDTAIGSTTMVDGRVAIEVFSRFEFPGRSYEEVVQELEANLAGTGLEPLDGAGEDLVANQSAVFTLPSAFDPATDYGITLANGDGLPIIVVSAVARLDATG